MTATEPRSCADMPGLFVEYLRYYRDVVTTKLTGLTDEDLRSSRLPSGWTPLELLTHLVFMERRWFVWGVLGEPVDDPWGDQGPDGRWAVPGGADLDTLLARLHEGGRRTEEILAGRDLTDPAATGGRFDADPPTVGWICLHVLQEYARHAGHLDLVRELADGTTGEG